MKNHPQIAVVALIITLMGPFCLNLIEGSSTDPAQSLQNEVAYDTNRDNKSIELKNPELALCLIAKDAVRAREFYVNSLNMTDMGEVPNPPPGLHMFLFKSGQATLKVRVYNNDPPGRNTSLLAENGLRFITIPVLDFDYAIGQLKARNFSTPVIQTKNAVRTGITSDGDGNVVEILDAKTAPTRLFEIGIIVSNLTMAKDFYSNILGFTEAASINGPTPLPDVIEYRYFANKTVLRIFSPPGTRPEPDYNIADVLGFRYITFTLAKDVDILHNETERQGIEIVAPLSYYVPGVTLVFMVRGPGGAIHEFIGPPHLKTYNMTNIQDYYAPAEVIGSNMSETLEALSLEPHRGRLFLSTSYVGPEGTPSSSDPKVLVKDTASSPWRIDYEAGNLHARIAILKSVSFTTDCMGNPLPEPVPVLVAGTGQWRSWFDENDPDRYGVYVLTRDDSTNQWIQHRLYNDPWNPDKLNHANEVRMIFDHVDRVTGVHYVFAGSQSGRLFRGWYNATQPGLVTWDPQPEIDGLLGNVLSAAEVNGVQYIGVAFGPNGSNPPPPTRPIQDYGLWRRIDGDRDSTGPSAPPTTDPQWEWIYIEEWENPNIPGQSRYTGQLRGITAIPDPKGGQHQVIGLHWDSPDCSLQIVDPMNGHQVTIELNSKAFFQTFLGAGAGVTTLGYNDWLPVEDPDSGELVHFIGAWAHYPGGEQGSEKGKSSWFLVRYSDATYSIVRIWDPQKPTTDPEYGLRGCRSIRPSPFPGESGRMWYSCGFDLTGLSAPDVTGSHGWVYKLSKMSSNDPPKINTTDVIITYEDELYRVVYTATDADPMDGLTWTYSSNATSWLEWDPVNYTLSGTPLNEHVGTYWVCINVTDDYGASDEHSFFLEVANTNDGPIIVTKDMALAIEDEPYAVQYHATDIDAGDKLSWIFESNATDWLNWDEVNITLYGTPMNEHVGSYWIRIAVMDYCNESDEHIFNLTVVNINDAPVIVTEDNTTVYEDSLYIAMYQAIDVDNNQNELLWNITTDAGWLEINLPSATIRGTPENNDVGEYWINISVNDGELADFYNFTLTVININDGPEINWTNMTITMEEDSQGISFDLNDLFYDIDGDILLFDATESQNITISINDSLVKAIPSKNWWGTEIIEFTAKDNLLSLKINITFNITSVNDGPTNANIYCNSSYYEGEYQWVNSTASDVDIPFGDILFFTWSSNITGVIGTGQAINLSLPPGYHMITLNVSDLEGLYTKVSKEVLILYRTTSDESDTNDTDEDDNEFPILFALFTIILIIILIIGIITWLSVRNSRKDNNHLMKKNIIISFNDEE